MWKIEVCFKGHQDVSCWSNLWCIIDFPRIIFLILCSVFFLFLSFYGALSILPTSSFWFFAAAFFAAPSIHSCYRTRARPVQFKMKTANSLFLSDQQFLCAVFTIREWPFFGAILRWLLILRCANFTIFVVMWPVLHAKHRFLKMHQRRRNTKSANGVYLNASSENKIRRASTFSSKLLHFSVNSFSFLPSCLLCILEAPSPFFDDTYVL